MAKFQKGNKAAAGVPRPNAGRPTDWFREQCQKAFKEAKALDFMRGVAAGEEFPQLATSEGEVLNLPPPLKDRRAAVEWLADRGWGKVSQVLEGPNGEALTVTVVSYANNNRTS